MQIDCYALNKTSSELAAAKIIAKAYAEGKRLLVRAPDAQIARALDDFLWTYDPASFIPHARRDVVDAENSPVLIVHDAAPQEAKDSRPYLVLLGPADASNLREFERVFWFFSRFDEAVPAGARELCETERTAGATANFWSQTEKGAFQSEEKI